LLLNLRGKEAIAPHASQAPAEHFAFLANKFSEQIQSCAASSRAFTTHTMPTRLWFRLAEIFGTLLLIAILLAAWRADRRDRAKLAADLAIAKQSLAQADARQHDRDAQLAQTLAAIAAEKRAVTTPAQILRELPQQLSLPTPITLQPSTLSTNPSAQDCSSGTNCVPEGLDVARPSELPASKARQQSKPQAPAPKAGNSGQQLLLPAADLKPLYDYTLDCQACQAKLSAAQADLTDERAKSTILTRERDEAVRAAKGGSLLRRVARNTKWLMIGAAAGLIAAKARP
jgi:hypothetical protein